jgi:outer membrane protein assembly factor BamE (lipoprotein component of BamABCDE complex)
MVVTFALVGLLALTTWGGGEAIASGVTRDAIRSVRVGMAEDEVVRILGEPLSTTVDQAHDVKTLEYTLPMRRARWYPMLWVHLKGGRVNEVYAKKYVWWGLDDEGVYGLSDKGQWEAPNFESTFRR